MSQAKSTEPTLRASPAEENAAPKPNTSPEVSDYNYARDPFYFAAATIAAKRDLGLLPPKHVR